MILRASSFYRDSNCFASPQMAQRAAELGNLPPEETEWSERGTRVHSGATENQDESDARTFMLKKSYEIFDQYARGNPYKITSEKEFFLREDGLIPYFSGHVDRFAHFEKSNRIVFLEFKPGFEFDLPAWIVQKYGYAVLLQEAFTPSELAGLIVTRFHGTYAHEYVADGKWVYPTRPSYIQDISEALKIVKASAKSVRPTPGPWCRYCKGRLVCKSAMTFPVREDFPAQALPGGEVGAEVLEKLTLIQKLAQEKIDWYTERVAEDPLFLGGLWKISKGRTTGRIANVNEAGKSLVAGQVLSPVEVGDCTTLSAPKLRDKIAAKHRVTKLEAKQKLDSVLGELISYTTSKGSLVKSTEPQQLEE